MKTALALLAVLLLAGCGGSDEPVDQAAPAAGIPVETPPAEMTAEEYAEGGDVDPARIAEMIANAPEDRAGNSRILDTSLASVTGCGGAPEDVRVQVRNPATAARHMLVTVELSADDASVERVARFSELAGGASAEAGTQGTGFVDGAECTVTEVRDADTDVPEPAVDWVTRP